MVAQYFGKATCDGFSLHGGRPELFAYLKRQKISEAVLSKLLYVFQKKKKNLKNVLLFLNRFHCQPFSWLFRK